jgi:hypothetical protein
VPTVLDALLTAGLGAERKKLIGPLLPFTGESCEKQSVLIQIKDQYDNLLFLD